MDSILITVRSSADTHDPIPDAMVFVNGVSQGTTGSSGEIAVTLPSSPFYDFSAKATGFTSASSSVPGESVPSNYVIELDAIQPEVFSTFVLTIQPEDKAANSHITFDNAGSPVMISYFSGGVTINSLHSGVQNITGSIIGYDPINYTVDISQHTSGTILLVQSSDDGDPVQAETNPTADPDVSQMLTVVTDEKPPEFIAPNTGQGTYFTMSQARLYIGNLFIDELNSIRWVLQDNKIPIYGYASRFADDYAQGKSLVQGELTINFISEGYLYTVLQDYQNLVAQDDTPENQVLFDSQARLLKLVNNLRNPDPTWTPTQLVQAKQEVRNLAASLGPTALVKANESLNSSTRKQNASILGLPGIDNSNAVYQDIPFDIILEFTGAGRNITRRLEECYLISNESLLDHSGTPILDSYGFIARKLR